MAQLEKLAIQGFRSFGHTDDDVGVIDFADKVTSAPLPVVLILGQNGCGKTTIIECLRGEFTKLKQSFKQSFKQRFKICVKKSGMK
jgi:DNA repair exonuclease SbcCD ATPase subunit